MSQHSLTTFIRPGPYLTNVGPGMKSSQSKEQRKILARFRARKLSKVN